MSDQPTAPAAGAPAPTPDAGVDHTARIAALEKELGDFKVRDGRFRNEKGVLLGRIKELEQLASNSTGDPGYDMPPNTTYNNPSPYHQTPTPPAYSADIVTKDEFDLYRFQRDHPTRFDAVRKIALDSAQVGNFIRYRVDAWGRPMVGPDGRVLGDIYTTYSSIANHLETEELKAKVAQTSPNRNPALGIISGNSAASTTEQIDVSDLTPEQMKEKFPEAFAPGGIFSGR
jgi:hypothetical protein